MENRAKIENIRGQYLQGHITYEEAKTLVEDILLDINNKGQKIAKKFGKKNYKPLTFAYVFR